MPFKAMYHKEQMKFPCFQSAISDLQISFYRNNEKIVRNEHSKP